MINSYIVSFQMVWTTFSTVLIIIFLLVYKGIGFFMKFNKNYEN